MTTQGKGSYWLWDLIPVPESFVRWIMGAEKLDQSNGFRSVSKPLGALSVWPFRIEFEARIVNGDDEP